jgi:SAM-dependent methyltransferase
VQLLRRITDASPEGRAAAPEGADARDGDGRIHPPPEPGHGPQPVRGLARGRARRRPAGRRAGRLARRNRWGRGNDCRRLGGDARGARQRLPACDVQLADLEALPFESRTFYAVVAVNSLFFARDVDAAMRELARVLDPAGRVVATCWGPPDRCQYTAVREAMATLGPPASLPSRIGPSALAEPGRFRSVVRAGRSVSRGARRVAVRDGVPERRRGMVGACQFGADASADPDLWRRHSATRVEEVDARHACADGTISFENEFVWAAGERA